MKLTATVLRFGDAFRVATFLSSQMASVPVAVAYLFLVRSMCLRELLVCIAAGLLFGCGTLEENAWTNGVSREDAVSIGSAVRAQKHAHSISRYERQPDGSIIVYTDVGNYVGTHVDGRWSFQTVIITE
jgi:hypothetical protein